MSNLEARLVAADAAGNLPDLMALYAEAADVAAAAKDDGAVGFYLTHAYVFALEAGLPEAEMLRTRLIAMGRDRRR